MLFAGIEGFFPLIAPWLFPLALGAVHNGFPVEVEADDAVLDFGSSGKAFVATMFDLDDDALLPLPDKKDAIFLFLLLLLPVLFEVTAFDRKIAPTPKAALLVVTALLREGGRSG